MKSNLCSYDVAGRFVLGCLILCVGIHFHNPWGLVGFAPLLTSLVGFCPIYWLLHIDTTSLDRPT